MGRMGGRSVSGEVALVTGGARGIGRAAALALAAAGHPVCINDTGVGLGGGELDPEPAEAVAAEIRALGGQALVAVQDARTPTAARELVAEVTHWAGRPPVVLVHAAGTLRDAMVHRASDDDWTEVLGSHLDVAVQLTRAMVGTIRSGRYGRVVYLGGAAGLVGSIGQAGYDVAKAGLFGLTRAVALELAGGDVCVNYLAPFAWTRMTESIPPVTDQLRRYLDWAPSARPEDVATVAAWLCSPAAAGISGQVFTVRGGELSIWSQPRPTATVVRAGGWGMQALSDQARPAFAQHLTPLESEFDLFSQPPATGPEGRPA